MLYVICIDNSVFIMCKYRMGSPQLQDPNIPNGEKITYNLYAGNEVSTVEDEISVKEEKGKKIYEIISKSKAADQKIKIEAESMLSFFSETLQKGKDAVVRRQIELVENKSKTKEGEIRLMDFQGILYYLRGFPFDKLKSMKVRTLGTDSDNSLQMEIIVTGKEIVKVNGKGIQCYKLKFGLTGILGALVGKTYLWYSVSSPHYLVRYEGYTWPGSKKRIMELISYCVK